MTHLPFHLNKINFSRIVKKLFRWSLLFYLYLSPPLTPWLILRERLPYHIHFNYLLQTICNEKKSFKTNSSDREDQKLTIFEDLHFFSHYLDPIYNSPRLIATCRLHLPFHIELCFNRIKLDTEPWMMPR